MMCVTCSAVVWIAAKARPSWKTALSIGRPFAISSVHAIASKAFAALAGSRLRFSTIGETSSRARRTWARIRLVSGKNQCTIFVKDFGQFCSLRAAMKASMTYCGVSASHSSFRQSSKPLKTREEMRAAK